MNISYENRLVAFIDILGFSTLIEESEKNTEKLTKVWDALKFLKTFEKPLDWNLEIIEIEESAQNKSVNSFAIEDKVYVTCISDSMIVSVNLASIEIDKAVSTLVANLAFIGAYLLTKGVVFRGGMTFGNLIHSKDGIVLGQALIDAYKTEKDISIYPRILLSKKLLKKLKYPVLSKNDSYPYHQYLKRFEDGCVGFHQLIFFEVIQSWDKMDKKLLADNLQTTKKTIINGLDENLDSPNIFIKYKWLMDRYNELCIIDEKVKRQIYELNKGIPGNNIHYSYTDNFCNDKKNKRDG